MKRMKSEPLRGLDDGVLTVKGHFDVVLAKNADGVFELSDTMNAYNDPSLERKDEVEKIIREAALVALNGTKMDLLENLLVS